MRIVMLIASGRRYFINSFIGKAKYGNADEMNYEAAAHIARMDHLIVSIGLTYVVSSLIIPDLGGSTSRGGSWPRSFPAAARGRHHS